MISSMHDASALTAAVHARSRRLPSGSRVDRHGRRTMGCTMSPPPGPAPTRSSAPGMAAGRGIAGFVAATGQSLTVRDVISDPRFARDVGERTGYVPIGDPVPAGARRRRRGDRRRVDPRPPACRQLGFRPGGPAMSTSSVHRRRRRRCWSSAPIEGGPLATATARLDRLPAADQARALGVIDTLLDAMER